MKNKNNITRSVNNLPSASNEALSEIIKSNTQGKPLLKD